MSVKTLLTEEIERQIVSLGKMEPGTETHKSAVDNVTKLLGKLNETEQIELERIEKVESRESEKDLKLTQLKEDKKDRFVKNIFTGIGVVASIAIPIWGTLVSLKFEETGTVTTFAGRENLKKLFSKR